MTFKLPLRERVVDELVFDDLYAGVGKVTALEAYQELEWRKCSRDVIYFIERYGWILLKSGNVERLKLFPAQVEILKSLERGESQIMVKARQLGFTTIVSLFALWEILFKEAIVWNFFGANLDDGTDIKNRASATVDRLPEWIKTRASSTFESEQLSADNPRAPKRRKKNSKDNVQSISFGLSSINIYSGAAKNVRGRAGKIFLDDFGKHEEQFDKWANAYPAINDPLPQNRGQVVIVFNGNGEDFCYDLYTQAKQGKIQELIPRFYDWKADPRRLDHPILNEAGEVISYQWYEDTKASYTFDGGKSSGLMRFKAEYPETEEDAFFVSVDNRFGNALTNGLMRLSNKVRPRHCELVNNSFINSGGARAKFRVYQNVVLGENYIMGIDTAGGRTPRGDASVCQVFRVLTDELEQERAYNRNGWKKGGTWAIPHIGGDPTIMVMKPKNAILELVCTYENRIEPTDFADVIIELGKHYNNALLVPEINNHGQTILRKLKDANYYNIYKRRTSNERQFGAEEQDLYGFTTTPQTKTDMINTFSEWLSKGWVIIPDKTTVKEISLYRYEQTRAGNLTTNAPSGQHDDHVIAAALAVVGANTRYMHSFKILPIEL